MTLTKSQLEGAARAAADIFAQPQRAQDAVRAALEVTPGRGGLTSQDLISLAKRAKVSKHMIQSLYLRRRLPSHKTAKRILKVLGRG